jgi:hypothetical protein
MLVTFAYTPVAPAETPVAPDWTHSPIFPVAALSFVGVPRRIVDTVTVRLDADSEPIEAFVNVAEDAVIVETVIPAKV